MALNFENEIKPALVNLMKNIKDKKYNSIREEELDLRYNLAISEALEKLKATDDFIEQSEKIKKELF